MLIRHLRDFRSINRRFLGDSGPVRAMSLLHPLALHDGEGGAGGGAGGDPPPPKTYTEADIAGLKSKNAELVGRNKDLAARAAIIGDRTPEEVQADLEFAAKAREKQAKDEGNFEALKTEMATKHQKALDALSGEKTQIEGKLFDVLGKREAEKEITALGIKPKVLLPHVLPHIKVVKVDGEYEAIVVDAKGNPRIADGQATPMSIKDLVAEIAADPDFDGAVPASGANGGGARHTPGGGGSGGIVMIPKDAPPQEYRRLKADAEKRGVPYQVAG